MIFKNFFNHLKTTHCQELTPLDQDKILEKDDDNQRISRQLKIGEEILTKNAKSFKSIQSSKKSIGMAMARMITEQAIYAFSIVDHHAFRRSVRKIVEICGGDLNLVQFPSRNTIRKYVNELIAEDELYELKTLRECLRQKQWRALAIGNDSTTSCAKFHYTCLTGRVIVKKLDRGNSMKSILIALIIPGSILLRTLVCNCISYSRKTISRI